MKEIKIQLLIVATSFCMSVSLFAQEKKQTEADRVKMEHAQIGIVDDPSKEVKHTNNPGAQWFAHAGLGMFIHWGINSINEIDASWPMMPGASIIRHTPKLDSTEVRKIMEAGDYLAFNDCKKNGNCITANQYWEQAKKFNPSAYDPDTWAKLAKAAGMTYMVLTTRHHDGFALWPSKFGDFNTKNYMGGKDLVKEYVTACRKYGLKVGLYYSGPDWYFNRDFQSFLYHGVARDYPNSKVPSLDADLHPRTTIKTAEEKQKHYEDVAVYIKGQVEELLTNYGQVDMIWFDGAPDIPKGNDAWKRCITMEQIRQLQPGIVVSPRFFGYGDYKTFEGDKSVPDQVQTNWAELCATIQNYGWGYIGSQPLKSTAYLMNQLAVCSENNANLLLNFGPTKEGVFSDGMVKSLNEIATWMKVNKIATTGTHALEAGEQASVPATASKQHRYLFVMTPTSNSIKPPVLPLTAETVTFKTSKAVKSIQLLGRAEKIKYEEKNGTITIQVPAAIRSINGDVLDVTLK